MAIDFQGADIIVFPEDGIYGMYFPKRSLIFPFMEYMPDPGVHWNPCKQPGLYPDTDVQTYLSCMAKDNGLYVVANIGDVQPCNRATDSKCPSDGRYQYNTNVVYDPDGLFISKYHKYNLYYEVQFDTPDTCDMATFETPFGKFGMLTCFDILFEKPSVTLVEEYNITDVVFPTAWMDAAPFLTSIQFHSSFALTHGVNFLSANIHRPEHRFRGSGVYTPEGGAAYYYSHEDGPGKLVVAEIPTLNRQAKLSTATKRSDSSDNPHSHSSRVVDDGNDTFAIRMFKDYHNAVPLLDNQGSRLVCHTSLCCNVTYNLQSQSSNNMPSFDNEVNQPDVPEDKIFFALAAYDGLHKNARYYMQICSIVKCLSTGGNIDCGYLDAKKNTYADTADFENFSISGNFSTNYVYPQILLEGDPYLQLTDYPRQWTYSNGKLSSPKPYRKQLNAATLFGRDYQRDLQMPNRKVSTNGALVAGGTRLSLRGIFIKIVFALFSIILFV